MTPELIFGLAGRVLAALASATDADLLQPLQNAADLAMLRERLEDDDVLQYISHVPVDAEVHFERANVLIFPLENHL